MLKGNLGSFSVEDREKLFQMLSDGPIENRTYTAGGTRLQLGTIEMVARRHDVVRTVCCPSDNGFPDFDQRLPKK